MSQNVTLFQILGTKLCLRFVSIWSERLLQPVPWKMRVGIFFWFLVCNAATQLATQLPQRCIQVVFFVLLCCIKPILGNCYGPGVIPKIRGPGVAGSSPSTLTTSLATPVPSSSSLNGPTTTPLTTRGLCPGGSVVWAGPKFVWPHW